MSVSFKAFLYERSWRGNPVEIRRFNVDQDVSSSYTYLLQKLTQVFPAVTTGNVSLAWTDSDGDMITISSDEELVEALGQFDGGLFKLYLLKKNTPDSTATDGSTAGEEKPAGCQQPNGPKRHWGVVCDGCSGPILGVRYKCLACADYDLCSVCEGKGIHVDHNMITITEPRSRGGGCPLGGGQGRPGWGRWGRHGCVPPTAGFPPMWGAGLGSGGPCGGSGKGSEQTEEQKRAQIRNIGQAVSNFLLPFGIKVDVDVTGEEKKTEPGTEAPAASSEVSAEVIEAALAQLRSMGHSDDEGGWLTELVKAKGGDITKVLDALHFTETD